MLLFFNVVVLESFSVYCLLLRVFNDILHYIFAYLVAIYAKHPVNMCHVGTFQAP